MSFSMVYCTAEINLAVIWIATVGGVLQKESSPLFAYVIAQDKGVKSRLGDDM